MDMLGRRTLLCSLSRWCNAVGRFSTTDHLKTAYDAEGKTTVTVLNNESSSGLMIDTYSKIGFRLNNGLFILGPMAIFNKTIFSWNVAGDDDINYDSLKLFSVLDPKLDILIIGFGGESKTKIALEKTLLAVHQKDKMNIEILPTDRAVATFNFLSAEGRNVGGALIPPRNINISDEEIAGANLALDSSEGIYEMKYI